MQIWPGKPYPLGATFDGTGTNLSLFSEVAERVELCLFDEQGQETRVDLPESTALCWHGYLPKHPPGPAIRLPRARPVGAGKRAVDLGTVEEGARTQLAAHSILSYRLLWFERGSPAKSPNEKGTRQILARIRLPTRSTARTPLPGVIARVHEALATAPSRVLTATFEDAMAVEERPNMPATTAEWPNWSIALPQPIETLERNPVAARIARALNRRARRRSRSG